MALSWLPVPEEMEGVSVHLRLELCQGWEEAPSLGTVC